MKQCSKYVCFKCSFIAFTTPEEEAIPHCQLCRKAMEFASFVDALTDASLVPAKRDAIDPDHYRHRKIECIEITETMNFNKGNALKYLWRAGIKDPAKEVEDLQKARWYIDREIKRLGESK